MDTSNLEIIMITSNAHNTKHYISDAGMLSLSNRPINVPASISPEN